MPERVSWQPELNLLTNPARLLRLAKQSRQVLVWGMAHVEEKADIQVDRCYPQSAISVLELDCCCELESTYNYEDKGKKDRQAEQNDAVRVVFFLAVARRALNDEGHHKTSCQQATDEVLHLFEIVHCEVRDADRVPED